MNCTYTGTLSHLVTSIAEDRDICSSGGYISAFPKIMMTPWKSDYIKIVVCGKGCFEINVDGEDYNVNAGETAFVNDNASISVVSCSDDVTVNILMFLPSAIKDILGNTVMVMRVYNTMNPTPCHIWKTGEEDMIVMYGILLHKAEAERNMPFVADESKLLLTSFTYRLCSLFSKRLAQSDKSNDRKTEIFSRLLQLVSEYYNKERSVSFYADKLCLSPKYLSSLVKTQCGYTVQELVFKALIRRSIFLMNNTSLTISEISNELNFPNVSSYGTFFKKHTGLSPRNYRNAVKLKIQP